MIPIVFLFFMSATCQEIGSISNQQISKLKSLVMAKRPDLVEAELSAAGFYADRYAWAKAEKPLPDITSINAICGCPANDMFSLAYVFSAAGNNNPKIDFIPVEDTEPTYGDIQRQTTTTATNTLTWKWEQAVEVGGEVEFSTGPFGIGVKSKATFKSISKGGKDETTTQTTQVAETRTFKCRPDHRCQLQTWTFIAEYEGDYYEMPVADFKCLPRSVQWVYKSGQSRELAASSKVSFASLLGKEDSWDRFSQRYFTTRDRATGQDMAETPVEGSNILGVAFPPESVEIVSNNTNKRGPATFPLMNDKGEPYRVTVLFDYSVKASGAANRKRNVLDGDLASEDVELEIFVVDTNIPGHDLDTVLANGTVVQNGTVIQAK